LTHAISAAGLALIQQYEGFCAEPIRLPDGNWVVGHGHVRVGEPGEPLSEADAAQALALDLAPYEALVNARVTQPLNQAQFDALVSFAFSIGAEAFERSQVLRRVNAGDFLAAACAIEAWRAADIGGETVVVDCLAHRRAAEKALFLRDVAHRTAPSVFLRAKLDHAASVLGAPAKYAPAPEVKHAPAPQPQPNYAQRLTEILRSEPATEALLLTQVVPAEIEPEEDIEIVTAHAKPVARRVGRVRQAARRAFESSFLKHYFNRASPNESSDPLELPVDRRLRTMRAEGSQTRIQLPDWSPSFEHVGLGALLLFGVSLIAVGGSLLFDGAGDLVAIAAAVALVTPGLAATLIGAYGFWRGWPNTAAP
jgi:GH24 family phage-related lysozyme (muramidase)